MYIIWRRKLYNNILKIEIIYEYFKTINRKSYETLKYFRIENSSIENEITIMQSVLSRSYFVYQINSFLCRR